MQYPMSYLDFLVYAWAIRRLCIPRKCMWRVGHSTVYHINIHSIPSDTVELPWPTGFSLVGVQVSCRRSLFKEYCLVFHMLLHKLFIWAGPIMQFGRPLFESCWSIRRFGGILMYYTAASLHWLYFLCHGINTCITVALWLVCQAVWVWALARDIVLCSWARLHPGMQMEYQWT